MEVLLLKMGEMVLKGLNRSRFESRLISSLRAALRPCGQFSVESRQSVVYAAPQAPGCDMEGAAAAAGRVFGFANLSRAARCEASMEALRAAIPPLAGLEGVKTFKVEARRADKGFPLTSPEICAALGETVLDAFPHLTVDVKAPDEIVWAEIREGCAYLHLKPRPGAGGLPVGTSGKAVLLLSGGIDSPVAGWRMARRGMELLPVHFYSYPYTSPEAKDKVMKLAHILSGWTGPMTVRAVPFTKIQEQIRRAAPEGMFTLLMRRSMMRIAAEIARRNGAPAIITGDSLGQVASQTLDALSVTGHAAAGMPVLRPLVGMDKEEVVAEARRIGTFETSILPYEDCCGVFTPRHPQTRPKLPRIREAEGLCGLAPLEEEALAGVERNDAYAACL